MTWLDSQEVSIAEALKRFPEHVNIGSISSEGETFLIALESLQNMSRMHLDHLPVSTVALPYDLSDILTRPHDENLVRDVSHHLGDFFPNFFVAAIYELQSLFTSQELNAFIIGGITRDMLLSSERRYDIQDVDITVEGKAVEAAHFVNEASKNFDLLQEFSPFGTAKLDYKGQIEIDFASTRREIYQGCGMLPEIVEMGVPLEKDIIRRDFTVNALALSVLHPGQVIDCTGGLRDLEARQIRILKASSFFEDPSRIIRALKFPIRMDFEWSEDTSLLLDRFLFWMPQVYKGGGDRIREELCMMLSQPETDRKSRWLNVFVEKGLHRLIDTQLPARLDLPLSLEQISSRLKVVQEHLSAYWAQELTWEVYIAFIFMGIAATKVEQSMHRLGLTRHEIEVVEKSFRLLNENVLYPLGPYDNPARLYDTFHAFPMATCCVGIILSSAMENSLEAFLKYKNELETVKLEVTGDDVMMLGIPQGEQVGRMLKQLFHAKLQGKVHNRMEEIGWLKAQMANAAAEESPS